MNVMSLAGVLPLPFLASPLPLLSLPSAGLTLGRCERTMLASTTVPFEALSFIASSATSCRWITWIGEGHIAFRVVSVGWYEDIA